MAKKKKNEVKSRIGRSDNVDLGKAKIVDEIITRYSVCQSCGRTGDFFNNCTWCGHSCYEPTAFEVLPIKPISVSVDDTYPDEELN